MKAGTEIEKTKAGTKIAEITTKIVGLLEPLESVDRQKAVSAALTLLGEAQADTSGSSRSGAGRDNREDLGGLPVKAKNWMKQNTLTKEQVEQAFHLTREGATVIASEVPGKSAKEKTHNAYVLQGTSQLLATGEANFDDKSARKLCEDLGCYDATNHATYMNQKPNWIAGAKSSGWKLTAPGLKQAAQIIKQLTGNEG